MCQDKIRTSIHMYLIYSTSYLLCPIVAKMHKQYIRHYISGRIENISWFNNDTRKIIDKINIQKRVNEEQYGVKWK